MALYAASMTRRLQHPRPPRSPHALSCRTCRARKVRCERPEVAGSPTQGAPSAPSEENPLPNCLPCKSLGTPCVTDYKRQRRGPRSSFAPRDSEAPSSDLTVVYDPVDLSASTEIVFPPATPIHHASTTSPLHSTGYQPAPPAQTGWDEILSGSVDAQPDAEIRLFGSDPTPYDASVITPVPLALGIAGIAAPKLEDVIKRDVAIYVLSLYFDYVYPLVPLVHRPTFMKRFHNQDDHKDPVFLGLILSILAASLMQIPKDQIPIEAESISGLAHRCHRTSRLVCLDHYDPPSLELVVLRFYDAVFNFCANKTGAWVASLGETVRLLCVQGIHTETNTADFDLIQIELRRRVFHTVYLSDKSAACMQDQPIMLRSEDCKVPLPSELDDEYITAKEYLPPPPGYTSKMSGHNAAAKVFMVIEQLLIARQAIRRTATLSPVLVMEHLRKLGSLAQELTAIINNLPQPLRHASVEHSPSATMDDGSLWNASWSTLGKRLTEATQIAPNDNLGDHSQTGSAFAVMQANIHVTYCNARLLLVFCRDEVINRSGTQGGIARNAALQVMDHSFPQRDTKMKIVYDLLDVVRAIPLHALATNSRSIVNKIRYIACQLLDSPADPGFEAALNDPMPLVQFLELLTEIEELIGR